MEFNWRDTYARQVQDIIEYSEAAYQRGLVSGTGGNISARCGEYIIITATNVPLRRVTPETLILCSLDGSPLDAAPGERPSKETGFHAAVYRARPDVKWVASEKVDGMSSSYVLDEKGTYLVCSHNVVVFSSKVKGSENIANGNAYIKQNVWLLMSEKYDMRHKLETLKSKFNAKTVAIQGEIYGDRVQKRTYGLRNKQDLAVFHIWINGIRLSMKETQSLCTELGLQMVHVFDWELHVPSTVEELIRKIDSEHSALDDGMIEGYVIYSQDGLINYKCVSPSYLLKYH